MPSALLIVIVPFLCLAFVVIWFFMRWFRPSNFNAEFESYMGGSEGNSNPSWMPETYSDSKQTKGYGSFTVKTLDPPHVQRAKYEASNYKTTTQKELEAIKHD